MRLDNWELDVISEHFKEWNERKFGEEEVRRAVGNMGGNHSPAQVGLLFLPYRGFLFYFIFYLLLEELWAGIMDFMDWSVPWKGFQRPYMPHPWACSEERR